MTPTSDLLAGVEALRPIIEAHVEQSELDCQLSSEVYEALAAGGYFRMLIPAAFGGLEMPLPDVYRIIEAISAIDGAPAWNLNQSVSLSAIVSWFPEAAATIFEEPDRMLAGALWPPGTAIDAGAGVRVNARMPFVSGSKYATWVFAGAMRMDGDEPATEAETDAPDMLGLLLAIDDVDVIDVWDPQGMRGTGSNDVLATDVLVPSARTAHIMRVAQQEKPAEWSNPMYGLAHWIPIPLHATVPLGIVRGALDEVRELVAHKVPNYFETPLGDKPVVQASLAEARSLLGAAMSYLMATTDAAVAEVAATGALTDDAKIDLQLGAANAGRASMRALDLVVDVAGTSSIRRGTSLERRVRDARTIVRHTVLQPGRFESCGQVMLGRDCDWFPFQL